MSSAIAPNAKHLYRSILRELRLASPQPRSSRNPIVAAQIRTIASSIKDEQAMRTMMIETRDFLRSSRIHADLLKRYNPLHDMSQEERIEATARRVGLNAPLEYKPGEGSGQE